MQKQTTFKPRKWLYPLFFISFITLTILSFHTYYPNIIFNLASKQEPVLSRTTLPSSLSAQILNLQKQVGSLLIELRSQDTETRSFVKFTDQVTRIAVSLDKIADSAMSSEIAPLSHIDVDDTEPENEYEEEEEGRIPFRSGEIKNYTSPKSNRVLGKKTFLGVQAINPTIGLPCVHVAAVLDRFMNYKLHGICPDDSDIAYKLLAGGCEPLPRRRCFSRMPPRRQTPSRPIKSSLWTQPDDSDIMWDHYKCKNYSCLVSHGSDRGFFKCSDCFNLTKRGWQDPSNESEFTIDEVLELQPGQIHSGLDFSPTTGTFAALMRERNVTIASATLNLGAPFNEVISLRGLLAVHVSVSSRLPFYDNTLDIVHSTLFLDGWIEVELLQFVLYDWDRVLRPKGLLWIDRFFCKKEDVGMYVSEFSRLRYKKLMWRIVPKLDKAGDEVFLSAVLEKPIARA